MSVKQPRTRKFMAHEPGFTIIDAMNRLFSGVVRRRELLGCVAGFLPRRGGRPSYAQAFGGIGGNDAARLSARKVSDAGRLKTHSVICRMKSCLALAVAMKSLSISSSDV